MQRSLRSLQEGETEPLEMLELKHQLVTAKQAELTLLLRAYEMYYQLQYVVGGTFKELSVTTLQK